MVATGDVNANSRTYTLQDADKGIYYLLANSSPELVNPFNYGFSIKVVQNQFALAFNSLTDATIPAGQSAYYNFHLDASSLIGFDSLTNNSNFSWQLTGSSGQVFNQNMATSNQNDVVRIIPAGNYQVKITNASAIDSNVSFQVLDNASATPVIPGQIVTTRLRSPNSLKLYSFSANAGERFYIDALSTTSAEGPYESLHRTAPRWKLLDPQGREVYSETPMGYTSIGSRYNYTTGQYLYRANFYGYDQEPVALTTSGLYTLVLEGANSETIPSAEVAFNIVKVPVQPTVVLDSLVLRPSPDLAINSVTLSPVGGLRTGNVVNVNWIIENRGLAPTTGNWNDRIIVRNLETGLIVSNLTVPYSASASGNGSIPIGEARVRNVNIKLPDGISAAGRLSFTVLTDADNVVKESNITATAESNNAVVTEVTVSLAAYVDLVVENLSLNPSSGFQPNQAVSVSWTTANRGNKLADHGWSERLELLNLSTNEIVASVLVQDTLGDGPLEINGIRQRNTQFNWPNGVSASGRFSFRIVADSSNNFVEANAGGTGESNNISELIRLVGPDMKVKNLHVETTNIDAGGLVTIQWEDWNDGTSSTASAYDDRIVVKNNNANLILLDTSITYNPLASTNNTLNGSIAPDGYRQRSFSFRLPEGLKGAGNIGITVTADQNSAGLGLLFETNLQMTLN